MQDFDGLFFVVDVEVHACGCAGKLHFYPSVKRNCLSCNYLVEAAAFSHNKAAKCPFNVFFAVCWCTCTYG
jgi:hypothetical protein